MKAKDLEERLLDTKKIYEKIEIPTELNERMGLALGEMSKGTEQKTEVIQTRRDEKRGEPYEEKMELEKNNRFGGSMCRILLYSRIKHQSNICHRYAGKSRFGRYFQSAYIPQL